MRCSIVLRFDYGLIRPLVTKSVTETTIIAGSLRVVLRTTIPVTVSPERIEAQFEIVAGQRITFSMTCANWVDPFPEAVDPAALLTATEQFWRRWISRFTKEVVEPDAVRRSLLTLKALTHHQTGGLVAAPTLGLPETLGGSLNWDYRFCWLRDATFTLTALLNAGYHDEATEWYKWLLRAAGSSAKQLQVLYRVDGSRSVHEYELPWLSGYERSRPVRAGNAAAAQAQLDIFGEVIDALSLAARAGIKPPPHDIDLQTALVDHIEAIWEQPDKGLWEARGEAGNHTYSRVMAWVGIDRFTHNPKARAHVKPTRLRQLRALARRIRDQVCAEGYDGERGHFVEYYGSSFVDGSLLLMPLVGFLPIDDPRITATIDAVERELMEDGLVRRRHAASTGEQEGAFIPCTCWLADCRAMQGRSQEARKLLARVLEVRNDVGLLAEEYDTARKRLLGNFPQALSHLALINTELQLSGPVLQRDGG
jgi:GH15 family glucan-1,4-alpha-glucosidase